MKKKDFKKLLGSYRHSNKSGLVRLIHKNPEYESLLKEVTSLDGLSISETLYLYYNGMSSVPRCPYCDSDRKFISLTKGYSNTCGTPQCKSLSYQESNLENRARKGDYSHVGRPLRYEFKFSEKELWDEYEYYKNARGSLSAQPKRNKIIKQFQQSVFYAQERKLLRDKKVREKLFANRKKYLGKDAKDLTPTEIYNGFKISGIWNGYSHFSPLWMKFFVEACDMCDTIYDPCGGWGHHMLGILGAGKKYVYNDFSKETTDNVRRIVDFFGMESFVTIYNEDATEFVPDEAEHAAWFLCPPYFNIEIYNGKKFKDVEDYSNFLTGLFHDWGCTESRYLGIVIREDYLPLIKVSVKPDNDFTIDGMGSFGYHNKKIIREHLYVYCKT